jgi:hypothetical protein
LREGNYKLKIMNYKLKIIFEAERELDLITNYELGITNYE